jgi:non-ribosomal peptide synthase protein (TIGR01720 family)
VLVTGKPAGTDASEVVVTDPAMLDHLWPLDAPADSGARDYRMPTRLRAELPTDAVTIDAAVAGKRHADKAERATRVAPRTEREAAMAAIWRDLLKIPEIGVHDDFFELGGDSMTVIQAVSMAGRAGLTITPRQFVAGPTIAELCGAEPDTTAVPAEQGVVRGELPVTSAQAWFFDTLAPTMADPAHFDHPYYLQLRRPVDPAHLAVAVAELARHHDSLRLRFRHAGQNWVAWHAEPGDAVEFESHDLAALGRKEQDRRLDEIIADRLAGLDLADGPLARFIHFGLGDRPDRLLIVCHHLVTDGVSRNLLLEDLQTLVLRAEAGAELTLPPKTTSYREWAHRLAGYAGSPELAAELDFWSAQRPGDERLPVDAEAPGTFGTLASVGRTLDEDTTAALREVARDLRVSMSDLLVWAAVRLAVDRSGSPEWTISTTGHGREALFPDVDTARTLGWFQVLYPVRLSLPPGDDKEAVTALARQLGAVPHGGIGYGLLRHTHPDPAVRDRLAGPAPALTVNYMGAFGFADASSADELFDVCADELDGVQDPVGVWPSRLDVVGTLIGDRLRIDLNYGTRTYRTSTADRLLADLAGLLVSLAGQETRKG